MAERLTARLEGVDADYLLDVLGDQRSRSILDAASGEWRSVEKISDDCDIPLSTIYRRVREMTEEGVLSKKVRYRDDGQHVKEYRISEQLREQEMELSPSLKLEVSYGESSDGPNPEASSSD